VTTLTGQHLQANNLFAACSVRRLNNLQRSQTQLRANRHNSETRNLHIFASRAFCRNYY